MNGDINILNLKPKSFLIYVISHILCLLAILVIFENTIFPKLSKGKPSDIGNPNVSITSNNINNDNLPVVETSWRITRNNNGFSLSTIGENIIIYGPIPYIIQDSPDNNPIYGRYCVNGYWGYFTSTNTAGVTFTPAIYLEAFPFEHQNDFARVRTADGWSLINSNYQPVLQHCKRLNPLPNFYTYGTGIDQNNRAFIFELINNNGHFDSVSKTFSFDSSITDISVPFDDYFCIINGNGVAALTGQILIKPDQYETISFTKYTDDFINETIYFFCEKNGKIQILTLDEVKGYSQ